MDATRISDGAYITLKSIRPSVHPYEEEIGTYLSSDPLSDPKNHCVPIYEVLQVPDMDDRIILVMPLLRRYDRPPLQTFGECVDFFQQVFEVWDYPPGFQRLFTPFCQGFAIHAPSSCGTPVCDKLWVVFTVNLAFSQRLHESQYYDGWIYVSVQLAPLPRLYETRLQWRSISLHSHSTTAQVLSYRFWYFPPPQSRRQVSSWLSNFRWRQICARIWQIIW